MELGKVPPHDIEAEQAVIRKYAHRQRSGIFCNRIFK